MLIAKVRKKSGMIEFNYVCSEEFVNASYFDMPPRKLKNEHLI